MISDWVVNFEKSPEPFAQFRFRQWFRKHLVDTCRVCLAVGEVFWRAGHHDYRQVGTDRSDSCCYVDEELPFSDLCSDLPADVGKTGHRVPEEIE